MSTGDGFPIEQRHNMCSCSGGATSPRTGCATMPGCWRPSCGRRAARPWLRDAEAAACIPVGPNIPPVAVRPRSPGNAPLSATAGPHSPGNAALSGEGAPFTIAVFGVTGGAEAEVEEIAAAVNGVCEALGAARLAVLG